MPADSPGASPSTLALEQRRTLLTNEATVVEITFSTGIIVASVFLTVRGTRLARRARMTSVSLVAFGAATLACGLMDEGPFTSSSQRPFWQDTPHRSSQVPRQPTCQ